jgi:hypothetical protein
VDPVAEGRGKDRAEARLLAKAAVAGHFATLASLRILDAVAGPEPETEADRQRARDRERIERAFPEIEP